MGDRGNIIILSDEESAPVYLYTHWGGTELPEVVAKAIGKRWRWDDPAYLARIIFDVLTESQHGKETGYGIATYPCDNEHDYIVVDSKKREVRVVEYSRDDRSNPLAGRTKAIIPFERAADGVRGAAIIRQRFE